VSTKASVVDQLEMQKYTPEWRTFIFVKTMKIGVYELWVESLARQAMYSTYNVTLRRVLAAIAWYVCVCVCVCV